MTRLLIESTSEKVLHDIININVDIVVYLSDLEAIFVVPNDIHKTFLMNIEKAIALYKSASLDYLFLVRPKELPQYGVRQDGKCDCAIFNKYFFENNSKSEKLSDCIYSSAKKVIDSENHYNVIVRELNDLEAFDENNVDGSLLSLSIPHQGDLKLLSTCLNFLNNSIGRPEEVFVYFDEKTSFEHKNLVRNYSNFQFFKKVPYNVGPYVARNHTIQSASSEYICFQDSDDVPTLDRFIEIEKYINCNSSVDMAGCHELRIDEIEEKVLVIRFPLNVSEALEETASHPLFHPTSFVKRSKIKEAGSFSTIRRYAADSQFLLRSHFFMNIRNIDKFLYLRRKRPGSLTTADDTKLESESRMVLDKAWKGDFEKIKEGTMDINRSSLAAEHLQHDVEVDYFSDE